MNRKEAGFTLIELMTVAAILVVTLTIGIPTFQSTMQRVRVETTLNQISADMAMARSSAVMRRSQVVVCPRNENNRCQNGQDWSSGWIVFEDADGNRQPDEPDQMLRVTDAPSGSALLYLPSTRPFVRYQPDGRSANTNLTIYLCNEEKVIGMVAVNNLGRVRTSREADAATCPRG